MQYSREQNTRMIAEAYTKMYEAEVPSKHYGFYVLSPDKKLIEENPSLFYSTKRGQDVDISQEYYEPELLGGRDYDDEGNPSERKYFYEWDGNVDYGNLDSSVPEEAMFYINGGSILVVYEYENGVQKNPRFFKALQRGWRELSDDGTNTLMVKLSWFKNGKSMSWDEISSFIDDSQKVAKQYEQLKKENLVTDGTRPNGSVAIRVGGKDEIWKSPIAAIKYYKFAASETDGSESQRYSKIAYRLQNGETEVSDDTSVVQESDWTNTMPDQNPDGYAFGVMPYFIKYEDGGFVPYHLSSRKFVENDKEIMVIELKDYLVSITNAIASRNHSVPFNVSAEKTDNGLLVLDGDEVRIAQMFNHCILVSLDGNPDGNSKLSDSESKSYVVLGVNSPDDESSIMEILQSVVDSCDGMDGFTNGYSK